MPTIVTIGEALVEIMRAERDTPLDRPATFLGPYPSGAPAIFADAAARLGARVRFAGAVGDDAFGRCIRQRLEADGVDCAALRTVPERLTGIAFVAYSSDGSRSFLFHGPASAAALVEPALLPEGFLEGADALHVMGSALTFSAGMREACYRAAKSVHARGGLVSLDPNLRPELMGLEGIRAVCAPVLAVCDVVLPSGEEATALTGVPSPGAAAEALLAGGARLVALKRGAEGSTLYSAAGTLDVAPFSVTEVDPTGAGDCFDAALLVGLLQGWPLPQAGALANAAGALATTRMGPMEGARPLAEVRAFMAAQGRPLEV